MATATVSRPSASPVNLGSRIIRRVVNDRYMGNDGFEHGWVKVGSSTKTVRRRRHSRFWAVVEG